MSVSIIIPCFNAKDWIAEALESCLAQTHGPIEVIVVDDGSIDQSLEIIKSFGSKVHWQTGPHCGGNRARNWGIEVSHGKYIQFLDADDYLLPEKIERQVQHLESTGADVVYGDWRHQRHSMDGRVTLEKVMVSEAQEDILAALLSGWWVAPAAVLSRREAVRKAGGWDESLQAAQDRDFMISAAMAGNRIEYQPGCYSVYRRYGDVTLSTSNRRRWLDNHLRVLKKAELKLENKGALTLKYRQALARSYFGLARNYFDLDRCVYATVMEKVIILDPGFASKESRMYNFAQRALGYSAAERLASWKRRVLNGSST